MEQLGRGGLAALVVALAACSSVSDLSTAPADGAADTTVAADSAADGAGPDAGLDAVSDDGNSDTGLDAVTDDGSADAASPDDGAGTGDGPVCGATGGPCCADGTCAAGALCIGGRCGTCGGPGLACCAGAACAAGNVCSAGACVVCGALGQTCCGDGSCSVGFVCAASNTCARCGDVGGPCCAGGACGAGAVCAGGLCACGGAGQPCCAGDACAGSGVCVGGACSACGGVGQPCCAGGACVGSAVCATGMCRAPTACRRTSDCASGLVCGGPAECGGTVCFQCIGASAGGGAGGAPCMDSRACAGALCDGSRGRCSAPCANGTTGDADCVAAIGPGWVCTEETVRIGATAGPLGYCARGCGRNADCPGAGDACEALGNSGANRLDAACGPAPAAAHAFGTTCVNPGDCATGICLGFTSGSTTVSRCSAFCTGAGDCGGALPNCATVSFTLPRGGTQAARTCVP